MPEYTVRCANCGDQALVVPMSVAAEYMPCPVCQRARPQVFNVPQFTEDRTRLWKGPLGTGYSFALGRNMPDSRKERDRVARERGVEFCSLAELRADNKEAAQALDYKAHVDAGGARDERPIDPAPVWQDRPAWARELT